MKTLLTKLDLPKILANSEVLSQNLIDRGDLLGREKVEKLLKANDVRKQAQKRLDVLNSQRKQGVPINRETLTNEKTLSDEAEKDFYQQALRLPNWIHPNVPIGDEDKAIIIDKSCTIIKDKKHDHLSICEKFDLADFKSASKCVGTKFVFLKRQACLLEMALQRMAVNLLTEEGDFIPVSTPDLIKPWFFEACGFQPRGPESQVYHIEGEDLCLVGTSEIAIGAMLSGTRLLKQQRLLGISHCFRTEAGASGKESKGLYRLHQFSKVEMFVACEEKESELIHQNLVKFSTKVCDQLGLMWRVLDMPSKELGASAYRKFDVEVYLPGTKKWGEVASISNTIDFQSRRLDIKLNNEFCHTLNGTACAVPRLLLALLETHQTDDDDYTIKIPKKLADIVGFDLIK